MSGNAAKCPPKKKNVARPLRSIVGFPPTFCFWELFSATHFGYKAVHANSGMHNVCIQELFIELLQCAKRGHAAGKTRQYHLEFQRGAIILAVLLTLLACNFHSNAPFFEMFVSNSFSFTGLPKIRACMRTRARPLFWGSLCLVSGWMTYTQVHLSSFIVHTCARSHITRVVE